MRARVPTRLLGLLGLLSACAWACSSPSEPSPSEPTSDRDGEPSEPALVELSLSLVDAPARAGLASRFDPDSALVAADVILAVRHEIVAPWHIYWSNPGDAGLRTKLTVTGHGFTTGPVLYPAPERIVADGGQVSYGWERDAVLFVPLSGLTPDAQLELRSDWLACHESCIPGHAIVTATLAELARSPDPLTAAMLARVPEPARDRLSTRWDGTTLHVEVPAASGATIAGWFPHAHADVTLSGSELRDNSLDLVYRWTSPPPAELHQGVLALVHAGETRFVELAVAWPISE